MDSSKKAPMSKKPRYWTRRLELQLVEFVREREYIWKPAGNTNHQIHQKYKAYAQFASQLGKGFTARSVRDRWANIRSTFNHNLRRVEQSRQTAHNESDIYVPCWPLWKAMQFMRGARKKEYNHNNNKSISSERKVNTPLKQEIHSDLEEFLTFKQRNQRTDRPRRKLKPTIRSKTSKCTKVLNDLVIAMKPLTNQTNPEHQEQSYWFFGRHVTERLNAMRKIDAECARKEIINVLKGIEENDDCAW